MSRLISDEAWAVATIWIEAEGEPPEGKLAVAEVIRNRMLPEECGVSDIVLRPFQFEGWDTPSPRRRLAAKLDDQDPIVRACAEAWNHAVTNNTSVAKGATLYLNPNAVGALPNWMQPGKCVAVIGKHHFFVA